VNTPPQRGEKDHEALGPIGGGESLGKIAQKKSSRTRRARNRKSLQSPALKLGEKFNRRGSKTLLRETQGECDLYTPERRGGSRPSNLRGLNIG